MKIIFQKVYHSLTKSAHYFLFVSLIFLHFSCSKDDKDPIPISIEPAEQGGIGIEQALSQFNEYHQFIDADSTVVRDPWGKDSIIEIPISASILSSKDILSEDIPITFSVDNSLVEAFNIKRSKHNGATYCIPFPDEAVTQTSLTSLIKKGSKNSDTVVFRINIHKIAALNRPFVLPIKLSKQSTTGDPSVNSNYQIVYYVFNVFDTPIANLVDLTGGKTALYRLEIKENSNTSTELISFKGSISTIFPKAVKLVASANPQLIQNYNEKNGGIFKQLPDQAYRLVMDSVMISAGTKLSADNFQLEILNSPLFMPGDNYLLPIQIERSQNASVSEDKGVLYVKVFITNIDSKNFGLTGIPIDRSNWSVTVSSVYGSGIGKMMLDGKNNTAWTSNSSSNGPHTVLLDMGSSQTVNGFLITPNYVYKNENITKMNIYSSLDGINWQLQGMYNGTVTGGTASNPDIKTVRFLSSVKGRYFRFEITESGISNYTGIGELNAIQ